MDRCKAKYGFSLPAVYCPLVTSQCVNEIIRVNNIDKRGAMLTIRTFVDFLFNLKTCIEKILGDGFIVKIYSSLDFMKEWFFYDHAFELYEILKNFQKLISQLHLQEGMLAIYLSGQKLYHFS